MNIFWSVDEKEEHWAGVFYRLRHQAGEIGAAEESVFSPAMISKLENFDPDIGLLLEKRGLLSLEGVDVHLLIEQFNTRTR